MKQKTIKMRHKKKDLDFAYVEFDSLVEALDHVSEIDLLKIYNYGARELAKSLAQGKDPLKPRQKVIKLDTRNLTADQIDSLIRVGILAKD